MVDAINPLDYFETSSLSKEYDFNNDGVVNITDYSDACLYLTDDDTANDIDYTKEELDVIFADLIKENDKKYATDEVTQDNANEIAETIISTINGGLSPTNATTLNELQVIGAQLTACIKQSAEVAKVLGTQIPILKKELEEIAEEKAKKEAEYEKNVDKVNKKTEELNTKILSVIDESNKLNTERQNECAQIVAQCVQEYKAGKHPDTELKDLIVSQLSNVGGFSGITRLKAAMDNCSTIGQEIKTLCSDIETIVYDIKTVTEKYNTKNSVYNTTVNNRKNVLAAANTASQEYQKGYTKRLELRQEIIDKYKVTATGDKCSSTNAQVQQLSEFLNNKELNNMPYADAWAILSETFDDCGLIFDSTTGNIGVPKGHDTSGANIYNALITSLQENYGIGKQYTTSTTTETTPTGYVTTTPTTTTIIRTDPISFTVGDKKYDFIQDRDKDGVLDDASEFLGAEDGWKEMQAYDTNNDGKISGDELKTLKMVSIDQTNGQFTFTDAASAGVTSIDLNSYKSVNSTLTSGDILDGTFSLTVNGETVEGEQTLDTEQNLNNKYATLFNNAITDYEDTYNENPFMVNQEKLDTKATVSSTARNIKKSNNESDTILLTGDTQRDNYVRAEARHGEKEKERIDEKENAKQEAEEAEAKAVEEETVIKNEEA